MSRVARRQRQRLHALHRQNKTDDSNNRTEDANDDAADRPSERNDIATTILSRFCVFSVLSLTFDSKTLALLLPKLFRLYFRKGGINLSTD